MAAAINTSTPTSTPTPKKVAILIGSTRAVRIGPSVAALIKTLIEESISTPTSTSTSSTSQPAPTPTPAPAPTLHLLDLATFHLPVFDEAVLPATVPALNTFAHAHSRAWNDAIAHHDAYVIVTAEYNFGVPGALKNAIDYLYHAWIGKPVAVVSYGILGGRTAAAQLRATLAGMHLRVVGAEVALEFPARDPANRNMSPGLVDAMAGVLGEDVVRAWKAQKEDVVEAWKELRALLEEGEAVKEEVKEEVTAKA